jgi:hypothetical protein
MNTKKIDLIKAKLKDIWTNWKFSVLIVLASMIFIIWTLCTVWVDSFKVGVVVFFIMGFFGFRSYSLYANQEVKL